MFGGTSFAGSSYASSFNNTRTSRTLVGEAEVEALDIMPRTFLQLELGEVDAEALDAQGRIIVQMLLAECGAEVLSAQVTASGTATTTTIIAEASAEAIDLMPRTFLQTLVAEAEAEGLDITGVTRVALGIAEAEVEALDAGSTASGSVSVTTLVADLEAEALIADIEYVVEGVPKLLLSINATRDEATIEVLNPTETTDYRIYRIDGFRQPSSELVTTSQNPYTDNTIDPTEHYWYKVSFVVVGTKDGQPYVAESRKSQLHSTLNVST